MLRGLAGLPWLVPSFASQVQIVSIDDIADTVVFCLGDRAPAKVTWELAHPQILDLGDIVAALRAWHGFPPRPSFQIPAAGRTVVARLRISPVGSVEPGSTTALAQLAVGVVGNRRRGRAQPHCRGA
jgi:uncharacterized protein YbjT (DUF2867 family)